MTCIVPMENLGTVDSNGNAWTDITALEYMLQTTLYDVTMTNVAPAGSAIADGYEEWYENSVTIQDENGNDVQVIPIGTSAADTPAKDFTQQDIWTGTAPIIIVIDDTTTGDTTPTEPPESTEPDTGDGTVVPLDPVTPSFLEGMFDGVISFLNGIKTAIEEIPSKFAEWFNTISTQLEELPSKFEKWFTDISDWLSQLWEVVSGIPNAIKTILIDALTYLFAPSDTFIQTKVETLISQYPFAETFLALGPQLKSFFLNLGASPPIIYINLGAAEGSYYLGGKEVFLDLSWYERYKPTMDFVIGGFIWLWLAWRVFLSLPGLIQGASGFWGEHKVDIGVGSTLVYQRELPSGQNTRRNDS